MADGEVKIIVDADTGSVEKKMKDVEDSFDDLGNSQKKTQQETEKTKSKFQELTETIEKQEQDVADLKNEYIQAVVNFGKNSKEAQTLKEKFKDLNSELEGNKAKLKSAADGLKDMGDSAEEAGGGFDVAKVAIGNFISDSLQNLGAKLLETIGSIVALADETREYREDMAKLDSAFSTAGHSTDTAKEAYNDFYKILGESDRSVEAVNHLAELTKNEEEVAKWSTICAGVTAKFGDSLPIEGLTEAANETAKVGQVTGPLADALNWAGISEDEFNKKLAACNSEQERATLITDTLNQKYQAAADEYNELTASTQAARDATNNMEQAQARMGAAVEPLTTAWTNFKANAMEALQPAIEGVSNALTGLIEWFQEHPAVLSMVTGAMIALGAALAVVTAAVVAQTVAQWAQNAAWLASPITWIIVAIVAAVGALVAGFLYLWNNCEGFREFWTGLWEGIKSVTSVVVEWLKQAFQKAWEAIKTAWDAVKPYFSMVWEGIKAVFSVVKTYLAGMFETAWTAIKVVWDAVKGYFQAVWDTIKGIFAVVKAVLSGNWKDAWEAIKGIVNTWKQYFSGIWDGIKAVFSAVGSWFGNTFKAAWDAIKTAWSAVKTFFSGIWDGIKGVFASVSSWFSEKFQAAKQAIFNVFSNIGSKFLEIGTNIVKGIGNGITNGLSWIKNLITGWVGNVKEFIKNLFGIHSPSKWAMDQVGKMISLGFALGIEAEKDAPLEAMKTVFDTLDKYTEEKKNDIISDIKGFNNEIKEETENHKQELKNIDEKYAEDKKKSGADLVKLEKEYNESIEKENKRHEEAVKKTQESIKKTVSDKMKELVSLGDTYKENAKKLWEDLEKSISDLQQNYDNQLASRTESIANSLDLWSVATKTKTNAKDLKYNLQSQVKLLDDYNSAIANLESRNVSEDFINAMKEMGVDSTGEIEALLSMTDAELANYVSLWEKKNKLAHDAALEELEPLKAETQTKIQELTKAAVIEYQNMRAKFEEESALLAEELKLAMIESGDEGYNTIISQIDSYTDAGASLMDGVVAGILDESPLLADAVEYAIQNALDRAAKVAEYDSTSDWSPTLTSLKDAMKSENIASKIQATVNAENARMTSGVGVRDTGFSEVAQAVGMQTAGINSLASEYRKGSSASVTVPLVLDGRELGRAIVDLGTTENTRTGLVFA